MSSSYHTVERLGSRDHRRGLRAVAVLEAVKGLLALLAGFGFFELIRHNVDLADVALDVLYFLHIDPDRRIAHALLHAAERMSDTSILTVLTIVCLYATLRFAEGYGLWRQRVWAEWLAIASGAAYLPFELYKLVRHPTAFHWAVLFINIGVVVYIGWVRWDDVKGRIRSPHAAWVPHGD
jgi:uncharacterized membrane protein (DUF2068 family)